MRGTLNYENTETKPMELDYSAEIKFETPSKIF